MLLLMIQLWYLHPKIRHRRAWLLTQKGILTWSFSTSVLALESAFNVITYHPIAVSKPGCGLVYQVPLCLFQWDISSDHTEHYHCISPLKDIPKVDDKWKKRRVIGLPTDPQHIRYTPPSCFVGQWRTASSVPDHRSISLSVWLVLQLVSDDHLRPREELELISVPRLSAEWERRTFEAHVSTRWGLEASEWLFEFLL